MNNFHKRLFAIIVVAAAFSSSAYAQSYTVSGNVSASSNAVRNASIIFTDNGNPTLKYTAVTDSMGNFLIGSITSVNNGTNVPSSFKLQQNYPNPFSSATSIPYELDKQSDVKVTIYDILGRKVQEFSVGFQSAGAHGIVWNGRDNFGKRVAAGVYIYRLQAGGEAQARKLVFGLGGENAPISFSGLIPSRSSEIQYEKPATPAGETFTVQIQNTDSTFPAITPQQFNNVTVQSDTTLDYSVTAPAPVMVYFDSTQQIIRGFGAANIVTWRPDMTPAEIQTAFGTGPGQLGLSIMRLRIPPDSTQFGINIPSAKAAETLGVTVIASPWTPPAWMKTNDNIVGGSLDTNNYAAFAAFLNSFADTMANNGAPMYAISVQNEPDANVTYESCYWTGAQFLNFMRNNAPAVGTPIIMPESESFTHSFSDPTLNDSLAASHLTIVGGHLYGTSPSPYPLALSKGKELWMTEYLVTDTTWNAVMGTAQSINDCMADQMSAYIWWYIIRFYGPINESGVVMKRGYVMSQYSKFVRPGSYRVAATANPLPGVYLTAYKNGSKVVVVVISTNSSSSRLTFDVEGGSASSFTPYVTSTTKNCAQGISIPVTGGGFAASLDASSVTTFVSN
ncbi:MAG TPA: FlgD immunoglobulin-like domain containing protein [Candidatus Kryptonia bacterium]